MKKILFYNKSLNLGGEEKVFIEYLKIISKDRNDIEVIIGDDCGKNNFFEEFIPENIPYKYLVSNNISKQLEYHKEKRKKNLISKLMYSILLKKRAKFRNKKLKEVFANAKYEVIVDIGGDLPPKFTNIPVIRGWAVNINDDIKPRYKSELLDMIKDSYSFITITNAAKQKVCELLPNMKEKIKMIYNPVDSEEIKKLSTDYNGLDEKEKEALKQKYIIMVSRIDEKSKDITTLIKAYKILENKIEEKLYIIGEGADRLKLKKLIKNLKLENKVIFQGKKKNPYIWIKNSNLFVLSSKTEGLPTVLLEAMSLNIPIISTCCGAGPLEILENGKYGKLVEVGNFYEMSSAIFELLNNKKLRDDYIKKSKLRIKDFSIKNSKKALENIINSVLEHKG